MVIKHAVNRTFQLKLTTLSPLVINSGKELSPLSDYFVLNGRIQYVDPEKFQSLLLNNQELLDRYSSAVMKTNIEGADNFLNKLIGSIDQLKIISYPETISYKGQKTLLLKEIIKSNEQPYIPGSGIKGAIKNAILYYWLTKKSIHTIEQFILENERNFKKYVELIPAYSRLKKLKNRTRLEEEELRRIRRLNNDIQNDINTFIRNIENEAFGITKDILRQPASNLKVSDSSSIPLANNVEVAALQRRSLTKGEDWDLNTQEYIKSRTDFDVLLQISDSNQDWQSFTEADLFTSILQESEENLKPLFEVLNHFANAVKDIQNVFKLETSIAHYKTDVNEALLFLGSGKGIYKNTILFAVRSYYELSGKDFINEFVPLIAKTKLQFEDFPNSIAHIDNQALGWIKVADVNRVSYVEKSDKSYTMEEVYSGQPIEAIFKERGKPLSLVMINVGGVAREMNVQGAKHFLQMGGELRPDVKCFVYWRNNHLNFNK